jgi:hypothetical protein
LVKIWIVCSNISSSMPVTFVFRQTCQSIWNWKVGKRSFLRKHAPRALHSYLHLHHTPSIH